VGPDGILLSTGQRRRIALARALFGDPFLIILDEPDTGLDGNSLKCLIQTLEDLRKNGKIIVFTTHNAYLQKIADSLIQLAFNEDGIGCQLSVAENIPSRPSHMAAGVHGNAIQIISGKNLGENRISYNK
jgi:ABC-type protease/lipase transport system fused ATPase/permease subunit